MLIFHNVALGNIEISKTRVDGRTQMEYTYIFKYDVCEFLSQENIANAAKNPL